MNQKIVLATVCSVLVFGTAFAYHGLAEISGRTELEMSRTTAHDATPSESALEVSAPDRTAEATRSAAIERGAELVPAAESGVAESLDAEASAERIRERTLTDALQLTVEESIYGRLDPGAVLELAQLLVAKEVDDRANPVPDPSGALFFPILDAPEGMKAELKVARSNVARYANVLGLEMELPAPEDSLYLEGVMRDRAVGRIQIWTDRDGRLLDMTIQTLLETDYLESEAQGLVYDAGQVTHGVLYHLDVENPDSTAMKAFGLIDGKPTSWNVPLDLTGGAPRAGDLEAFKDGLLALYQGIRER